MIIQGRDIPLVLLRSRHERKISKREYARIRASILAVGLIEPLLVFPENDYYIILNGHQRYRILLELGVETVPCIFAPEKESFTGNRMVNRLSPLQEGRMIKKSLDELDEKTIATALGITHIAHRLNAHVVAALEDRGHMIIFDPPPLEIHRQAAMWFHDKEVFDFISEHLHLITAHSLRTYLLARELKKAGMDWKRTILGRFLLGRLLLVAQLKADPELQSEVERVRAFREGCGGGRSTYFKYAKKLCATAAAEAIEFS
jgi:ParB-like chromosome segregation protein Spo0J